MLYFVGKIREGGGSRKRGGKGREERGGRKKRGREKGKEKRREGKGGRKKGGRKRGGRKKGGRKKGEREKGREEKVMEEIVRKEGKRGKRKGKEGRKGRVVGKKLKILFRCFKKLDRLRCYSFFSGPENFLLVEQNFEFSKFPLFGSKNGNLKNFLKFSENRLSRGFEDVFLFISKK